MTDTIESLRAQLAEERLRADAYEDAANCRMAERDEARADGAAMVAAYDAEKAERLRINDILIRFDGRVAKEKAAAESVIAAARRLVERSASITEEHPAYGFLIMGIPLAKALALYDAALAKDAAPAPERLCCEKCKMQYTIRVIPGCPWCGHVQVT